MLEMRDVCKHYPGKNRAEVLNHVSLKLEAGKTLGLMGGSGSGKSTAARILLMAEPTDSGAVYFHGKRVDKKDRGMMRNFRRKVQYISQHPESFLDPNWKIGKSVLEGAAVYGEKAEASERLGGLLEQVKLNRAVLERYPHQVSGGEIQRASLCRALLLNPEVLILDEATSMLDVSVQAQILNILKEIQKERGISCLFISHDREVVSWFTDEIAELKGGQLYDISGKKSGNAPAFADRRTAQNGI